MYVWVLLIIYKIIKQIYMSKILTQPESSHHQKQQTKIIENTNHNLSKDKLNNNPISHLQGTQIDKNNKQQINFAENQVNKNKQNSQFISSYIVDQQQNNQEIQVRYQEKQQQKQKQQQGQGQQQQQSNNDIEEQNNYGSPEYWQHRYTRTKGQRFDWLQNYTSIKNLIIQLLDKDKTKRILNVGCGNGQIQDYLYEQGYKYIYNNDISKQVIKQMNIIKQAKKQDEMIYEVMDVTAMSYPDRYFDLVIDKSTIDALLCSQNPYLQTARMLQHIERVLKDNGIYLAISYSDPSNRMKHFTREHYITRLNQKGDKLLHYAYICKKDLQKDKLKQFRKDRAWLEEFYRRLEIQEMEYYGDSCQK